MLAYLDGNRRSVARFVAERLPGVRHFEPEATFLAWLDCRGLDLAPSPQAFFLEKARVALSDGSGFGPPGRGFARLNFATSRPLLDEITTRIEKSLRERADAVISCGPCRSPSAIPRSWASRRAR